MINHYLAREAKALAIFLLLLLLMPLVKFHQFHQISLVFQLFYFSGDPTIKNFFQSFNQFFRLHQYPLVKFFVMLFDHAFRPYFLAMLFSMQSKSFNSGVFLFVFSAITKLHPLHQISIVFQ